MRSSRLKSALIGFIGLTLISAPSAHSATIILDEAVISGDFTSFTIQSTLTGFADTGDIGHYTVILGLQNSANGEEAITFAPVTGFPSTGQILPDHSVPPFPPGGAGQAIWVTSAIVNLITDQYSLSGVLQNWTQTLITDYTFIVGLQNSNNGEEAITFSGNVTIAAPAATGLLGLSLIAISLFRRNRTRI